MIAHYSTNFRYMTLVPDHATVQKLSTGQNGGRKAVLVPLIGIPFAVSLQLCGTDRPLTSDISPPMRECVKGGEKGVLRKSLDSQRVYRIAGLSETNNQFIRKKRNGDVVEFISASAMAYSALATVPASGDAGPDGPTPRPSLRTIFFTLWASAAITLHRPPSKAPATGICPIPTDPGKRRCLPRWSAVEIAPVGTGRSGCAPGLLNRPSDIS